MAFFSRIQMDPKIITKSAAKICQYSALTTCPSFGFKKLPTNRRRCRAETSAYLRPATSDQQKADKIATGTVWRNTGPATASPVMPAKPQHPTAQRQMSLEIPGADRQERILKFLSLFDEAQKSAIPTADPKVSGIGAYAKTYGKKVETEGVNEGPSDTPSELSKDLLEISPLHGKNFWKPSLPTFWKIKRACFWKYCIERK